MRDSNKLAGRPYAALRGIGSLWMGAVLLVVLLVGMACATVFESKYGAEQALAFFYRSWWFDVLLVLLAVNVGAAMVVRFPFSRKQVGFVMTHVSILVILAGALVTQHFAVNGEVAIAEGDTEEHMSVTRESLIFIRRSDSTEKTLELDRLPNAGLRPVERPAASALDLDDVRVEVARYLPDSTELDEVVNDDPRARLAVEISISGPHTDSELPTWVFAGQTVPVASIPVLLREVNEEELHKLSAPEEPEAEADATIGSVRIDFEGSTYEFSVEECQEQATPVGETGYTLKVLRYMPHALVGSGNKLENASERPVNPTIEVQLVGPEGSITRPAFANFPEFWSMHGGKGIPGLAVKFIASGNVAPETPISVLSGPDDKLYARFAPEGEPPVVEELALGTPCDSPWVDIQLTVLRRFDHARRNKSVVPVDTVRKDRVPAVLLEAKGPADTQSIWLRKYRPSSIAVRGSVYDAIYTNQRLPLGFSVTLEDFEIGHYPGTMRPRSFESQLTITDPASGREIKRLVSMNNPTKFGGYTFYQSSYEKRGDKMVSRLSVARDPGKPIVFIGYIGILAGMLLVLGRRIIEQRARDARRAETQNAQAVPA